MTLQDEQRAVDQEIAYGVCDSVPRDWEHIELRAHRTANGIQLSLSSESPPGIATPTERLEQALRQLFLLNERYQTDLREAVYTIHWTSDGIRYEAEYGYDS